MLELYFLLSHKLKSIEVKNYATVLFFLNMFCTTAREFLHQSLHHSPPMWYLVSFHNPKMEVPWLGKCIQIQSSVLKDFVQLLVKSVTKIAVFNN